MTSDEMTRRAAAAQAIARVLACFSTDDPDTWTAQQRVSPIRVGDIKRAKDALVVLQTEAGEGWWHQVAIGLAAEIGKMQATWPRCEWRAYPGGPQCEEQAGCGCHSRLHGRAEISPAPETPDACENCGTVFDDTTMKFITWDDIELCERCHQEIPESQRREEFES